LSGNTAPSLRRWPHPGRNRQRAACHVRPDPVAVHALRVAGREACRRPWRGHPAWTWDWLSRRSPAQPRSAPQNPADPSGRHHDPSGRAGAQPCAAPVAVARQAQVGAHLLPASFGATLAMHSGRLAACTELPCLAKPSESLRSGVGHSFSGKCGLTATDRASNAPSCQRRYRR
jgi:hypothetical protein